MIINIEQDTALVEILLVADGLFNSWEEVNNPYRPVYQWNNNKIQPGDIRYVDINGDGKINDQDQVPIGYSNFPGKKHLG